MEIFEGKVLEIGPLVREFSDAGILVFFGEGAPPELKEFSIIHDGKLSEENVKKGDYFSVIGEAYKVLAVGEVANKNFRNLGHLIVKFNGKNKPELPGDICVENRPIPEINVGYAIKFSR